MAAKGTSKSCCCTGCEGKPFDSSIALLADNGLPNILNRISFAGHGVDKIQGFCCSCLPDTVCVSVIEPYSGASLGTISMRLKCEIDDAPDDGYFLAYKGFVLIPGQSVGLEFSFRVVNERCYFCMKSNIEGMSEICILIEPEYYQHPYYFCRTLCTSLLSDSYPVTCAGYSEFEITSYDGDTLLVRISGEDMSAIHGRPPCKLPSGAMRPDEDTIGYVCRGCGCVCSKACLFISYTRTGDFWEGQVTRNGTTWGTGNPYDPEVEILADTEANGKQCLLKLKTLGSGSTYTGPFPSTVISVENGQCPETDVRWEFSDPSTQLIIATFTCTNCLGCKVHAGRSGCCYGYSYPRVLHITIWTTGGATSSCLCLPVTLPMLFYGDKMNPAWRAELDVGGLATSGGNWCSGTTPQNFLVTLQCTGAGWQIYYAASTSGGAAPCEGTLTASGLVCEPLNMQFETSGICCVPSYPYTDPIILHFEITE